MDAITLEHDTLASLHALELPPTMAGLLAALLERVGAAPGYFTHPLALPVLQLPAWLGAPAHHLPSLALAGALGYLSVRVQDDLIDDGVGDPGEAALLSALLLHHHDAALAALTPGPLFWSRSAKTWAAYGEAMLIERRLHAASHYTTADLDRVLDRSRPLALPTAAWLCADGRAARLPDLDALVSALVRAHQLHTDLLDLETDCAAGRRTWLLAQLGDPPDTTALRRLLFAQGGLDTLLNHVRCHLRAVADLSQVLGIDEAAEFAARRMAALDASAARVQEAFFRSLLGM